MSSTTIKSRKSYTIKQKLDLIKKFQNSPKMTDSEVQKKHHVTKKTIKRWIKLLPEFQKAVADRSIRIGQTRKLHSGRKPFFKEVEDQLYAWIKDANKNGIHVKDREAQGKALKLYELFKVNNLDKVVPPFKATSGWLSKFKNRYKVSVQSQLSKTGSFKIKQ